MLHYFAGYGGWYEDSTGELSTANSATYGSTGQPVLPPDNVMVRDVLFNMRKVALPYENCSRL